MFLLLCPLCFFAPLRQTVGEVGYVVFEALIVLE